MNFAVELEEKRKILDEIDEKIAKLFLDRLKTVKEIGSIKKENNLDILDKTREEKIIQKMNFYASDLAEKEYLVGIYKNVMEESRKAQS